MGETNRTTQWWSKDTVAVVTGANKGIGFDIVRQLAEKGLTVVLTARDTGRGEAAVARLKEKGLDSVVFHPLDIGSAKSVTAFAKWLKDRFGGIDILVNNAGIQNFSYDYDAAEKVLATNYYALKNVTKSLLPLLRSSPAGARIVNVTSRGGLYERLKSDSLKQVFRDENNYSEQLADSLTKKFLDDMKAGRAQEEGWIKDYPGSVAIYSESKLFANVYAAALAKSLAKSEDKDHQIFVSSFCPGVTDTDMGHAAREEGGFELPEGFQVKTVAEGADTGVWLALLPKKEWPQKNGKFFGERTEYLIGMKNPPIE